MMQIHHKGDSNMTTRSRNQIRVFKGFLLRHILRQKQLSLSACVEALKCLSVIQCSLFIINDIVFISLILSGTIGLIYLKTKSLS